MPELPAAYRTAPFDEHCAPRRLLRLFNGKWTTMVLHTLHLLGGSSRPGHLLRSIPDLSKKMMTQTLRELEQAGLIARTVQQIMPPVVEYSLTEMGQKFIEPIEMLYHWGIEHADLLDRVTAAQHAAKAAMKNQPESITEEF
ncbi:winged helix-turn-helix transcriptional regulator [Acetobacter senegalensis]|uniref:winged helix-turn-helix transcriptional regulator n=1 Tax=Acetobacter senegalensis TaxID=446692 RepID=UPI00128D264B|nr:helix-turn-helix domain-containing protein [Acetobacter senegalensis]MCG4257087.1 helix-turn-helix transcriptional regulator [Acetobacter senegalensis]MCG4266776.1 helix-turn-helix transcriptional regulator [Acetobacter senegalensis]MPQ74615.1 transcriptional regulator [Acetobacter senegalensis]